MDTKQMREHLKWLIDNINSKEMLAYLIIKAAKAIKAQEK